MAGETAESEGITFIRILFFAVVLGLVVVALLSEHRKQRKERRRILEERWKQFSDELELHSVSAEEACLLKEMAEGHDLERPVDMFRSRRIFDECVNKRISRFKSEKLNPDALKSIARKLASVRRKLSLDVMPAGYHIISSRGISVGQTVEVQIAPNPKLSFASKVLEADDLEIVIQAPTDNAVLRAIRPGSVVLVEFSRDSDARYRFETPVIRVESKGTGRVYLEHTVDVERYQSREYFRAMMMEPIFFYPISEEQLAQFNSIEPPAEDSLLLEMGLREISGDASTISGGGIAIVSPEKFEVERPLLISVDPYLERPVGPIPARICSISSLPGRRYLLRTAFTDLDESVRDTVINYVSRLQVQSGPGSSSGTSTQSESDTSQGQTTRSSSSGGPGREKVTHA